MYDINWSNRAKKQLRKIDITDRKRISDAVDLLADCENAVNVKRLVNHQYGYRLRVGRYRVLFDVQTQIKIVDVQEVTKRDDRTY
ncbi:cytotoxic translational repressor of toxin-antitoxin stability system [Oligella sp. HMSC05A10]|uniref:type II toxin-antitoxin system RelE family toxin n=1 Tax=Oligella sp. HMSC05A10 TaxID=1581112 RepID=UPI0008A4FC48|nr:type II toxin-antitoxin system RelE/ParE family toxin [Oligella sp. HMSC05A10]OFS84051.1 cytotoxic translational repressor of toxin-antitoxin stability system [Oligella sp. HMSC05A10]